MLVIEQLAIKTPDIDAQVHMYHTMGHRQWVRDTVEAVHLFTHPDYTARLGQKFKVHLAFNYEFLPGVEFELIQLVEGQTWQLMDGVYGVMQRTSHFGYHTEKDQSEHGADSLMLELSHLQSMSLQVMQVSQTIAHRNTDRRYRYAFVTGDMTGHVPIKVIQRLLPRTHPLASVEEGKKLYRRLHPDGQIQAV